MSRHDELLALAREHTPRGTVLVLDNDGQLLRGSNYWEIRFLWKAEDWTCCLLIEDWALLPNVMVELEQLKERTEGDLLDRLAELAKS